MKLISSYKDYYDFWARDRLMSDQTYVWDRKQAPAKVDFAIPRIEYQGTSSILSKANRWQRDIEAKGFIVWFCGRPVPAVKVVRSLPTRSVEFFYSFNDMPSELVSDSDKMTKRYNPKWKTHVERWRDHFDIGIKGWDRVTFEQMKPHGGATLQKVPVAEMHRRLNTPVFCHTSIFEDACDDDRLTFRNGILSMDVLKVMVNPRLADISFHKVVDAFAAFQEIERFLANDLAPRDVKRDKSIKDNPIPDKINAESHGFDQHSFRQERTTTKKRRR